MERDTNVNVTDAVKVSGQPFVVGSGRNQPNAVGWTMLANRSQQSGVPSYLHITVLLKRQANDNGIFLGGRASRRGRADLRVTSRPTTPFLLTPVDRRMCLRLLV